MIKNNRKLSMLTGFIAMCSLFAHPLIADEVGTIELAPNYQRVEKTVKGGSKASAATPLLLEDVLQSARSYVPDILLQQAKTQQAAGNVQAARGAFDVQVSADGFSRATGTWTGQVINNKVSRNLGVMGANVYGAYRVSDGRFPIYEDGNYTNTFGEAKVGALFSLLRGRDIDDQRFTVRDRKLVREQRQLDLLFTQMSVQRQAMVAYWNWVVTGAQKRVYQKLLDIALVREKALTKQVAEGAVADIFLLENRQNITRRQTLLASSEQRFEGAAVRLSYYLRDEDGAMRLPNVSELPGLDFIESAELAELPELDTAQSRLRDRPELRQLRVGLQRLQEKIKLRQNDLSPKLDLSLEVSRDFGSLAEGGSSRDSTDTVLGFNFSVPLGQNAAKGRLRAARAERKALLFSQQQTEDKINIELEGILVDLKTSLKMLKLAKQDVRQSHAMEEAERKRFASGASDFFLLNIREENAANAEIRHLAAQLQLHAAEANFLAATMDASLFAQ